MSAPAVTIRNLTKRHRLGIRETYPMLRETLAAGALASWRWLRSTRREESGAPCIQALDGIDLDVVEGEVLGIVGRNGAGKSTLLKILAGITEPSTGYAEIRGRVGSLLEVGAGFHWELTGRENIYMNGALLGMRRREIDHKFDDIVAFSEVEAFLDTPVKRYSSGMYMRLAFAVAAHLEPDVLIVDEVLAVGDLAFQKKCLGRMSTIAHEGRTVLFVSHNMASVQSLCSRAVLLDRGKVVGDGAPRDVIGRYIQAARVHDPLPLGERKDRSGDGSARMTSVRIESADPDGVIRSTSRLRITIAYTSGDPLRFARFVATVLDVNGTGLFALDSGVTGGLPEDLPAVGLVTCVTDPIHLTPGRCHLTLRLQRGAIDADWVKPAAGFDVESDDFFGTGKEPTREWVVGLLKHAWSSGGAATRDGAVRYPNGTKARILDE